MLFNNENQGQNPKIQGMRLYFLPPESDFVSDVVEGLIQKICNSNHETSKKKLPKVRILTSSIRSASRITSLFGQQKLEFMPIISQVEELSDLLKNTSDESKKKEGPEELYFEVISDFERYLHIESLLQEYQPSYSKNSPVITSFEIADSLTKFLKEIYYNSYTVRDIGTLPIENYFRKWSISVETIQHIFESYENKLLDLKKIDPIRKFNIMVGKLITHWEREPYREPLLLVGSTGTRSATSDLIRAISFLPQGAVIFPGLDKNFPVEYWDTVKPDHPQYGFSSLSKKWGLKANLSNEIYKSCLWYAKDQSLSSCIKTAKSKLLSIAMQPAILTEKWHHYSKDHEPNFEAALKDISIIEAENSRVEAAAICAKIKKTLDEERTVTLVSPSSLIARRVSAELRQWDIEPYNTITSPLLLSEFCIFLRQTLNVLSSGFVGEELIPLLKNPNCSKGSESFVKNTIKFEFMGFLRSANVEDLQQKKQVAWGLGKEFYDWYCWIQDLSCQFNTKRKMLPLDKIIDNHIAFSELILSGGPITGTGSPTFTSPKWGSEAGLCIKSGLEKLRKFSNGQRKMTFIEYRSVFEKLFEGETLVTQEDDFTSRVSILSTSEARIQTADLFILAGLNEGTWPISSFGGSWLSGPMKEAFNLDFQERKLGLAAQDFQLLGSMAQELVLSRSLTEEGVTSRPSRWLLRLENLLAGLNRETSLGLKEMKKRGEKICDSIDHIFLYNQTDSTTEESLVTLAPRPAPRPPRSTLPKRISVNEIETLINNPYAIYAKHILKLEKLRNKNTKTSAGTRALLLHEAFQNFAIDTLDDWPDFEEALERVKSKYLETTNTSHLSGVSLSHWKALFLNSARTIIHEEQRKRKYSKPLKFKAPGKLKIELTNGEIFEVTAKADRIDIGPSGYYIYEYKLGAVSSKNLEYYAPHLDILGVMLRSGKFDNVMGKKLVGVGSIGLGTNPINSFKELSEQDLNDCYKALTNLIERMVVKKEPFVARLSAKIMRNFNHDYDHLSRYGEWLDDDLYEVLDLE